MQSQVMFNRVPEKVPEKVWEALVQSQVRFNRVPEKVLEKVPEKVPGGFGAEPGQVKVPEKVWEALVQSQVRFNRVCRHLIHGSPAEVFPALGFAAHFRKTCKNKTLRLLGISPFFFGGVFFWHVDGWCSPQSSSGCKLSQNVSVKTNAAAADLLTGL